MKERLQNRLGQGLGQKLRQSAGLLDWLLQIPCPLCDRLTAAMLCPDCCKQVDRCQLHPSEQFVSGPVRSIDCQSDLPVFAWGCYGGALKRTIAALKYQQQPRLARPLGDRLAQAWINAVKPASEVTSLTVIPIPLYAEKQQQRGFNQAERLAEAFCDRTGLPLLRQGLIRVRSTEAQFQLNAAAREQNLIDAFQVGQWGRTKPAGVLLIDDIYTTGATARTAAQALQQQNINVWGIAVIARAQMNS